MDGSLIISKEVSAATEDAQTVVPANGEKITVYNFRTSGPSMPNAYCKLIWDWGGAGEELLWSSTGIETCPQTFQKTGDGVKKLAIALDNNEDGALVMSAYCRYLLE